MLVIVGAFCVASLTAPAIVITIMMAMTIAESIVLDTSRWHSWDWQLVTGLLVVVATGSLLVAALAVLPALPLVVLAEIRRVRSILFYAAAGAGIGIICRFGFARDPIGLPTSMMLFHVALV